MALPDQGDAGCISKNHVTHSFSNLHSFPCWLQSRAGRSRDLQGGMDQEKRLTMGWKARMCVVPPHSDVITILYNVLVPTQGISPQYGF
jgi:hypothetical protein